MRKSEYICDICGAKITTDDITSGKTLDKKNNWALFYR